VAVFSPIRLFGDALVACLQHAGHDSAALAESDLIDLIESSLPPPDVVLFDIISNETVGLIPKIAETNPGILMIALSVPRLADEVIACADAGFGSYVPRDCSFDEMMEIVSMAKQGEVPCDPKISRHLLDEVGRRRSASSSRKPKLEAPLTARESEVAELLAAGRSNKEIARLLGVSVATVKNHVHSVLHKLGLQSRSEVASLVSRQPWLVQLA
jgi:DNA-binding NarL/FixJ family response regulator